MAGPARIMPWVLILTVLMGAVPASASAQAFLEHEFNRKETWWDEPWWRDGVLADAVTHPIETLNVTYPGPEVEIPAFLYRPRGGGKFPAVLFLHGRAGLLDEIRLHARRVAARGFVVLAPDLYAAHFIDPYPVRHDYALEDDANAGLDYLLARPDVSTTRACSYALTRGGYYALKVAVSKGRQENAAACYVAYYPHLQDPNAPEADQVYRYAPEADRLTLPALVFIGAEEQYQRRRGIETAFLALRELGRDATLMIYPGVGRGFDFRPEAVRTFADDLASKDALRRAAAFMQRHLRKYRKP